MGQPGLWELFGDEQKKLEKLRSQHKAEAESVSSDQANEDDDDSSDPSPAFRDGDLLLKFDSIEAVWRHLIDSNPGRTFNMNTDGNSQMFRHLLTIRKLCKHHPIEAGGVSLSQSSRATAARRLELVYILDTVKRLENGSPPGTHHRFFADHPVDRSIIKTDEETNRLRAAVNAVLSEALKEEFKVECLDRESRIKRKEEKQRLRRERAQTPAHSRLETEQPSSTRPLETSLKKSSEEPEVERSERTEKTVKAYLDGQTPFSLPTAADLTSPDSLTRQTARILLDRVDCITSFRESDQAIKGVLEKNGATNDARVTTYVRKGGLLVDASEEKAKSREEDQSMRDQEEEENAASSKPIEIIFTSDSDHILLHTSKTARYLVSSYWSPSEKKTVWRLLDLEFRDNHPTLWNFADPRQQIFATQLIGSESSHGITGIGFKTYMANEKFRELDRESPDWYNAVQHLRKATPTPISIPGSQETVNSLAQLEAVFQSRIKVCAPRNKKLFVNVNLLQACDRTDNLTNEFDKSETITKKDLLYKIALVRLNDMLEAKRKRFGGVSGATHQPSNHSYKFTSYAAPSDDAPAQLVSSPSIPPAASTSKSTVPESLPNPLSHCVDKSRHSLPPSTWSVKTIKTPGLLQQVADESAESTEALEKAAVEIKRGDLDRYYDPGGGGRDDETEDSEDSVDVPVADSIPSTSTTSRAARAGPATRRSSKSSAVPYASRSRSIEIDSRRTPAVREEEEEVLSSREKGKERAVEFDADGDTPMLEIDSNLGKPAHELEQSTVGKVYPSPDLFSEGEGLSPTTSSPSSEEAISSTVVKTRKKIKLADMKRSTSYGSKPTPAVRTRKNAATLDKDDDDKEAVGAEKKKRTPTKGIGVKGEHFAHRSLTMYHNTALYRKYHVSGISSNDPSNPFNLAADQRHVHDAIVPMAADEIRIIRDMFEGVLRQVARWDPAGFRRLLEDHGTFEHFLNRMRTALTDLYAAKVEDPAGLEDINRLLIGGGQGLSSETINEIRRDLLDLAVSDHEILQYFGTDSLHRNLTGLVVLLSHKRRDDLSAPLLQLQRLFDLNFAGCGASFALNARKRVRNVHVLLARSFLSRITRLVNYEGNLPFRIEFTDNQRQAWQSLSEDSRRLLGSLERGTRNVGQGGGKDQKQSGIILSLLVRTLLNFQLSGSSSNDSQQANFDRSLHYPLRMLLFNSLADLHWNPDPKNFDQIVASCASYISGFLPVLVRIVQIGHHVACGLQREHERDVSRLVKSKNQGEEVQGKGITLKSSGSMKEMRGFETFGSWHKYSLENQDHDAALQFEIFLLQIYPFLGFSYFEFDPQKVVLTTSIVSRLVASPSRLTGMANNQHLPNLVRKRIKQQQQSIKSFNSAFSTPLVSAPDQTSAQSLSPPAFPQTPSLATVNNSNATKTNVLSPAEKATKLQETLERHDRFTRLRKRFPDLVLARGVHDGDVDIVKPASPNARLYEIVPNGARLRQLDQACRNLEKRDLLAFTDSTDWEVTGKWTNFITKRLEHLAPEFLKVFFRIEHRLGSRIPTGNYAITFDGRVIIDLVDPSKLTWKGVSMDKKSFEAGSNRVSLGMDVKEGLENYLNAKPALKTAYENFDLSKFTEIVHPRQQSINLPLIRVLRFAPRPAAATGKSQPISFARQMFPFFELRPSSQPQQSSATIGLVPRYWSSKLPKTIRRDENGKLLALRGPDPSFPDSGPSRALSAGETALAQFDRQYSVKPGGHGKEEEAVSSLNVPDKTETFAKVHFVPFDLGTKQYVAGVVPREDETISFKQGSTDQKKREREDSKVVEADRKHSEAAFISNILTGDSRLAGGLATLFARNFSLDQTAPHPSSAPSVVATSSSINNSSAPAPTSSAQQSASSSAASLPPSSSLLFPSDLFRLPSDLQSILARRDIVHATRAIQNRSFRRRLEDSSARKLVNKLFPKLAGNKKQLVVVVVGKTDMTSKGGVGIGKGKAGIEAFLNAIKSCSWLELELLMVDERNTSKFCVHPDCSFNLVHPYRNDSSSPSPILRLKVSIECHNTFHRDFIGSYNILRKALDLIRKGHQSNLKDLKSTDILGRLVRYLLGKESLTNRQTARLGRSVFNALNKLENEGEKTKYLSGLGREGLYGVEGQLRLEAAEAKEEGNRYRGQDDEETDEGELSDGERISVEQEETDDEDDDDEGFLTEDDVEEGEPEDNEEWSLL
ncbi:uncharacterized protein JCM6883_002477 [Sporobolomyces salmoneus]|uniref:uncharacterized protein n=1 Tax=Sporobolomyces salmoneus TaxID=183962 RepID=UPI00316D9EB2